MSAPIRCHACGEELDRFRGWRRRTVVCPICGTENEIPPEPREQVTFNADELRTLVAVQHGLAWLLAGSGLALLLVAVTVGTVLFRGVPSDGPFGPPWIVAAGAFSVVTSVGLWFCTKVPRRTSPWEVARTAFTLQCLATAFAFAVVAVSLFSGVDLDLVEGLVRVSLLGTAFSMLPFHAFASRLGHLLGRHVAGAKGTLFNVLGVVLGIVILLSIGNGPFVGGRTAVVVLAVGLAVLHVSLLFDLRKAIAETVAETPSSAG